MSRALSVTKMHLRDKFSYAYLPWIILLCSFTVNLIIGFLIDEQKGYYSGGLMSIYIYMFVSGIVVVPMTFPFSQGLGIRRTDYFIGTSGVMATLSAVFSALLVLLAELEAATSG